MKRKQSSVRRAAAVVNKEEAADELYRTIVGFMEGDAA